MWLFLYILTFLFSLQFSGQRKVDVPVLALGCFLLILIAGLRSYEWPDTQVYIISYRNYTNTLSNFSFSDTPLGYTEKGFYLLTSILKTIYNNETFYLLGISLITMGLIGKSLDKYSVFPLIGMMIYIARFFPARNMMQIRAALAIAVLMFVISCIYKKQLKQFLLLVFLASTLHFSAILALPFYWLDKLKLNRKKIFLYLIAAFVVSIFFSVTIKDYVTALSAAYEVGEAYTKESSSYTEGLGLLNPMIYYQVGILVFYTLFEKRITYSQKFYYILRNGYFLSTIILIVFSSFGTLSGRTSTILATLEIFIVPQFILAFSKHYKWLPQVGIGAIYTVIFYLNWNNYFT